MWILSVLFLGFVLGSFLNVLIDRFPRHEQILKGRSRCEFCKRKIALYDLVPILSFLILKGKCRYCKAHLSLYYPVVELTTGLMFVITFIYFPSNRITGFWELSYFLFVISGLIAIFFMDLKYGIISDKVLLPLSLVSTFYLLLLQDSLFMIHLASAVGVFLFFLFLFLVTRGKGMGFGDVKLAFFMGLVLGFPNIIVGLYVAFLTGAAYGVILILCGKKKLFGGTIPFGPFLALGTLISIFFGDFLVQKLTQAL